MAEVVVLHIHWGPINHTDRRCVSSLDHVQTTKGPKTIHFHSPFSPGTASDCRARRDKHASTTLIPVHCTTTSTPRIVNGRHIYCQAPPQSRDIPILRHRCHLLQYLLVRTCSSTYVRRFGSDRPSVTSLFGLESASRLIRYFRIRLNSLNFALSISDKADC